MCPCPRVYLFNFALKIRPFNQIWDIVIVVIATLAPSFSSTRAILLLQALIALS